MYCPNCGAEYRANFTVCSDCQVPLVTDPPGKRVKEGLADPDEHDSFNLVWSGADPRGHAEACEVLARAGIPTRTIQEQDHLIYATVMAPFEVYVPSEFAARAMEVIKASNASEDALDQLADSGALEIPAEDDEDADGDVSLRKAAPKRPAHYDTNGDTENAADDASSVVWAGGDSDLAHMIQASLRENSIASRAISEAASISIFVLPEDEQRAQEIIREITDATPPN